MKKRSDYIDEREREIIEILYQDYFGTFRAAEYLTYNQEKKFTKKIYKIVNKALHKDVKRIKKAIRKEKWDKLTPAEKRKRKIILYSSIGAGIFLLITLLIIFL